MQFMPARLLFFKSEVMIFSNYLTDFFTTRKMQKISENNFIRFVCTLHSNIYQTQFPISRQRNIILLAIFSNFGGRKI